MDEGQITYKIPVGATGGDGDVGNGAVDGMRDRMPVGDDGSVCHDDVV